MTEKHTPGPWTYRHQEFEPAEGGVLQNVLIDSPHATDDGVMGACSCCDGIECTEADVRLICAAPELLAACRDLLDAFWDMSPLEYAKSRGLDGMSDHEGECIKERARAVIAKSTGKVGA